MELNFGNEESLEKVLTRALQYNDPYRIYSHMVQLYIRAEKFPVRNFLEMELHVI